jgi:hypothetical protein
VGFGHLPELAPEVGLLLRREGLVTEENHMMCVQGLAHGSHHPRRQRHRQVDVPDLRPDGGREWVHAEAGGEGHRGIVPEIPDPLNPGRLAGALHWPTMTWNADERTADEW